MSKHKNGFKRVPGGKKAVIGSGLFLLLLIGGTAAWWLTRSGPEQAPGAKVATGQKEIKTKEEAIAAMSNPQLDYDRQGASQALGTAAQDAASPEEKADLYQRQALVEYQGGNYAEAASIYEKSLDVLDNQALAFSLADTYEKAGNKQKAIEYYQRTKEYYESKPEDYSGRTFYIDVSTQKIKELSR